MKSFSTITPGTLTVALPLGRRPLAYVEDDRPAGFEIDLLKAVAFKLALQLDWIHADVQVPVDGLGRRFDVVVGVSSTKEQPDIGASRPYFTSYLALVVDGRKSPRIRAAADLADGDVIGVVGGRSAARLVRGMFGDRRVQVSDYRTHDEAFAALSSRAVTAVMCDVTFCYRDIRALGPAARVQPLQQRLYRFAAAPEDQDLVRAIDRMMQQVIFDGEYENLFRRHFGDLPLPPEYAPPDEEE